MEELLQQHQEVFRDELGTVSSFQASLQMKTDATPKFFKSCPVPFAIKEGTGCELDRMQKEGIIEKIEHSEWASPIVTVPEKDGCFRICGDYKVTINQNLAIDQYPLPGAEELFATLAGGKIFTKLDLAQAYLQVLWMSSQSNAVL